MEGSMRMETSITPCNPRGNVPRRSSPIQRFVPECLSYDCAGERQSEGFHRYEQIPFRQLDRVPVRRWPRGNWGKDVSMAREHLHGASTSVLRRSTANSSLRHK
ncbi:hypothetical protein AMTR_s00179p00030720 [Amborella trichopoda]|uniref:Uncharacterized protein n=1 Tax=Amborella trichopoda TaxID=13333 RepID=W1PXK7_AMBTC|nr:hypothetical protein AMTR_s00179p00030720 [Amborella trichopoda]